MWGVVDIAQLGCSTAGVRARNDMPQRVSACRRQPSRGIGSFRLAVEKIVAVGALCRAGVPLKFSGVAEEVQRAWQSANRGLREEKNLPSSSARRQFAFEKGISWATLPLANKPLEAGSPRN